MDWYVIDKEYFAKLYEADEKVGFIEYGDRMKLHVGIVLECNKTQYYLPISSPKEKHSRMSNSRDFHKIEDVSTRQLLAVININNMIPVPQECATLLKYDRIDEYRSFSSDRERINYIYLLQKEKTAIDKIADILIKKATKLRLEYEQNPHSKLAERCCNFPVLEEIARSYNKEREN